MASDDKPTGSGRRALKDYLAIGLPAALVLAAGIMLMTGALVGMSVIAWITDR